MGAVLKEGVITGEIQTKILSRRPIADDEWKIDCVPLQRKFRDTPLINLGSNGGGEGGCCIFGGTQILLMDGTTKAIENFSGGEMVRSLLGSARVRLVEKVKLGFTRHIIELSNGINEPLLLTDDHPIWTRVDENNPSSEYWGTYNASHYLYEKGIFEGYPEKDAAFLRFDHPNAHAHVTGWRFAQPIYHSMNADTPVYNLILDTGDGFIANDYVVFSNAFGTDFNGVRWVGLLEDSGIKSSIHSLTS